MEELGQLPELVSVEPNKPVPLAAEAVSLAPADDPVPWGLDRIDQDALPLSGDYTMPGNGGAGVTAYVIDTDVLGTHVDFGGRLRSGFSPIPGKDGSNDGCDGHGTHVAGTSREPPTGWPRPSRSCRSRC